MAEERKKSRRSFKSLPRRAQNAAFAAMRRSGKIRSKSKISKYPRKPKIGTSEQRKSAADVLRNMRNVKNIYKTKLWKRQDNSGGVQMRAYISDKRGSQHGYIAFGRKGEKYSSLTRNRGSIYSQATKSR